LQDLLGMAHELSLQRGIHAVHGDKLPVATYCKEGRCTLVDVNAAFSIAPVSWKPQPAPAATEGCACA
jgi:hypothetical protein